MIKTIYKKRVRYGETDQMGYLYYGNYAQYYEIGRVEMLRDLGISYRDMEKEEGIILPVVSMQVRYLRPAFYDELLEIKTTLKKKPDHNITFDVEISNEKSKIINAAQVKLCFYDLKLKKTCHCPEYVMRVINPFFND
jgi:acyl-CoA thioester hydrolase